MSEILDQINKLEDEVRLKINPKPTRNIPLVGAMSIRRRKRFAPLPQERECRNCGKTLPIALFSFATKTTENGTSYHIKRYCRLCYAAIKGVHLTVRKKKPYSSIALPEAKRARGMVREAVKLGRIEKPKYCPGCGKETTAVNMHGHHHRGYEHPLDIVWRCRKCHAREHLIEKWRAA